MSRLQPGFLRAGLAAAVLLLPVLLRAEDLAPALWAAAKSGDAAAVEDLLRRGADPNASYKLGFNALHYAAMRGHTEVLRVLLEHGADPGAKDEVNELTALTYVAMNGSCDAVELLLRHGADPNQRDVMRGQTPLFLAASRGHERCVDALLASGRMSPRALDEAREAALQGRYTAIAQKIDAVRSQVVRVPAWPQFRGPASSGIGDGEHPPAKWDVPAGVNLAWATPIPGLGHSSPVLWGDRLFVTSAVGEQPEPEPRIAGPSDNVAEPWKHSWRLYCLDRKTGGILWERTAAEGLPATRRHPINSFASASPATDGHTVVAVFESQGLFAYTVEGQLLWKQDLGTLDLGPIYDPDYQWGTGSSPILYRDLVIVQVDRQQGSFLAAFALKDGRLQWKKQRDESPSWGTPNVSPGPGRPELVTNATNSARAYDPATGEELWRFKTGNSMITAATPVFGLDLIFIANGFRPLQPIYAIRPGGQGDISLGEGEMANAHVAWSLKGGGPYYTTPLLYGELLYILSDRGILTSYYAKTGEIVYRQRLGNGGPFFASPVAADGLIYLAGMSGEVYVVRAGVEYALVAVNPVGESLYATPAIADGTLYLRGRHRVFALRAPSAPGL
jgi:outer membrane protein assembly factor BamB